MRETLAYMRRELGGIYPPREVEALIRIIFEYLKGWDTVELVMHEDKPLYDYIKGKVRDIVARLLRYEPVQYITGKATFYGLELDVNPSVLIPRPETAELVELIVKQAGGHTDLRVLDAATGSGSLALALCRNLRFPEVTAVDISPEALEVAARNSAKLKCRISLRREDILSLPRDRELWDIIVSNPPYIDDSEAKDMDANVLYYEPHSALFVPDSDPLRFYRALGLYGIEALTPGGLLYFEINPRHADELRRMLSGFGYSDIEIYQDMQGRRRFICARRPKEE